MEKVQATSFLRLAFLRSLGIPEKISEMDAEGIEHHVSPETLTAFERRLKRR